jgi:hypothetical protein
MLIARDPSHIIEEQHRIVQQIGKLARTDFGFSALMDFARRAGGQGEEKRAAKSNVTTAQPPLVKAIQGMSAAFKNSTFDVGQVIAALEKQKYALQQRNPRDAVSKALRKLRSQGIVAEVKKGKGGAKTIYKFVS